MKKELRAAYSVKEEAELLLSNLENLKADGSIADAQYEMLKAEYTKISDDALLKVDTIKTELQKVLDDKTRELGVFKQELSNLEARFKVGQIPAETYLKQEKGPKRKVIELERQVSELQTLVNSTCSADIGGAVPVKVGKPKAEKRKAEKTRVEKAEEEKPSVEGKGRMGGKLKYIVWGLIGAVVVIAIVFGVFSLPVWTVTEEAAEEPPVAEPPPAEEPVKKPAEFEVGSLTFTPSTIMVDDSATVSVTVRNIGGTSGTHTATLIIDGTEVDSESVVLEAGGNYKVSFEMPTTTAGEYKVAVGQSSGVVTVYDCRPYTIQYAKEPSNSRYIMFVSGEEGHAVHFTPPGKAFEIQRIGVKCAVWVRNDTQLDERQFTVRIWNRAKTQRLWSQDFPWRVLKGQLGWREIDVPDVRVDDDFFVEIVTHSDESKKKVPAPGEVQSVGLCYSGLAWGGPGRFASVGPGRSFASYMVTDTLLHVEPMTFEWFIRVEGKGPPPEKGEASSSGEQPLYEDDFSNVYSGWQRYSGQDYEAGYKDGEYHILMKDYEWAWVWNRNAGSFTDFILDVDARLVSGVDETAYGLVFRLRDGDNFYAVLASANGSWGIGGRFNGVQTVFQQGQSDFIKEDNGTHHLQLVCKGSRIEAYVNGHHLTTVTDDSIADGYVGMIVMRAEPNDHVAFDNFRVHSVD